VASEVGKSRSHVANTLRLLKLPESVKAMLRDGRLTAGHARTLIGLTDPEARAREILAGALNVRDAERRSQGKKGKIHKRVVEDPNIKSLEQSISNRLGLKVKILHKGDKGGEVRISYKSLEQLDDLTRRLKNGK
jgi:ParB family chromosome partitioning protein